MTTPRRSAFDTFKPTTPEGREAKKAAQRYLAKIRTREQAFEVLKRIGIYNEDGSPNPYFHPEAADKPDK